MTASQQNVAVERDGQTTRNGLGWMLLSRDIGESTAQESHQVRKLFRGERLARAKPNLLFDLVGHRVRERVYRAVVEEGASGARVAQRWNAKGSTILPRAP